MRSRSCERSCITNMIEQFFVELYHDGGLTAIFVFAAILLAHKAVNSYIKVMMVRNDILRKQQEQHLDLVIDLKTQREQAEQEIENRRLKMGELYEDLRNAHTEIDALKSQVVVLLEHIEELQQNCIKWRTKSNE